MAVVAIVAIISVASLYYFLLPVDQPPVEDAPPEIIENVPSDIAIKGASYFEGVTIFSGGGPACDQCHSLLSMRLFGGGLAPDLSNVFLEPVVWGKLLSNFEGDESKLRDFLKSPPQGDMKEVWDAYPLIDDEVEALVELLKYAATQG